MLPNRCFAWELRHPKPLSRKRERGALGYTASARIGDRPAMTKLPSILLRNSLYSKKPMRICFRIGFFSRTVAEQAHDIFRNALSQRDIFTVIA